jgi:hypothetical protein
MAVNNKTTLIYVGATLLAVACGAGIAMGDWVLPALALCFCLALLTAWAATDDFDARVLSVLLAGYIIGNRGFAQISPIGGVPLFPAELGLAICGALFIWKQSRQKRISGWSDGLSAVVFLWVILNAARFAFDFKAHGFYALKDFALVYYALFFFIAQAACENASDQWPMALLRWSCTALLPLSLLVSWAPDFFYQTLTFRGVPIIFLKGDLVGIFMSVGVLLWWRHFEEHPRRWPALVICLALAGGVVMSENRASLLGLIAGVACIAMAGSWRLLGVLTAGGIAGALAILIWAHVNNERLEDTPVYQVANIVQSIVDFDGRGGDSDISATKAGNNMFRLTWWRTVIDETSDANPWVGLGYGYDLSRGFLQAYYPGDTTDFLARSPHNVLITVFARSGLTGLAVFGVVIVVLVYRTSIIIRARDGEQIQLWACAWVIFMGACLGVVLEGPMGAVVFWVILGAANARYYSKPITEV